MQQKVPGETAPCNASRLTRSFFERPTRVVARDLLGTRLVHAKGALRASGIIHEVEAYIGSEDLASHARAGPTRRNRAMWGPAGFAYVYFSYGMHWLFNVVTEHEGFAAAVLVRGLVPDQGLDIIQKRRGGRVDRLTDGPAKICQALAVNGSHDQADLCASGASLYLEKGLTTPAGWIRTSPRIGIDSVPEPWRSIPWRFYIDAVRIESALEKPEVSLSRPLKEN